MRLFVQPLSATVTTKGHLFVRWEGAGERFNVEATSHGLSRFADDYYRHGPFVINADEEAAEGYLKSLNPDEELAVFLSIRGMCQRESGNWLGAAESFTAAASGGGRSGNRSAADTTHRA